MPALTHVFMVKRNAETLDDDEALPLLRESLRPRRARQINKRKLKKVCQLHLAFVHLFICEVEHLCICAFVRLAFVHLCVWHLCICAFGT